MRTCFDKPHLWSQAPSTLGRSIGRVDVWRVLLDQPVSAALPESVLSPDEWTRAKRFRFERDHNRFVQCRTALRHILSQYLRLPACEIRLDYQANGKPELAADQNPERLRFNVAHSSELALIAVGFQQRLGIDIERMRADIDIPALSEQCFSAREQASLLSLHADLRFQAFFACWTRKEAFIKATGEGLSFPLSDFTVAIDPEGNPNIEEIRGDRSAAKSWYLTDLNLANDYYATLAVEGFPAMVKPYCWN